MQKSYALFDFDGTLIRGDSIVRLCLYLKRRGLIGAGDVARAAGAAVLYLCRLTGSEKSKQAALRFLCGRDEAEVAALSADFCRDELLPRLRPEGVAELRARAAAGDTALLVTASPGFYLEPLKAALPVADIIATRMDVRDGKYTGLICGDNCRGVQKPLRLAEYLAAKGDRLDYDRSSAYGDSPSDAPMLQLCARKVVVNGNAKLLKALRAARGVETARWEEPRAALEGGEANAGNA